MGRGRWLRLHWDRTAGWTLVAVGGLALVLGWLGVSGTPFPAEQMSYLLSGGVIGGVLVLLGAGLLISADLRDEWHKLDRIEAELRRQGDTLAAAAAPVTSNGHQPAAVTVEA